MPRYETSFIAMIFGVVVGLILECDFQNKDSGTPHSLFVL